MKKAYPTLVILMTAAIAAGAQTGGGGTVTLSQAVDLALREGPDVRQAALTLESARTSFSQARASNEGVTLSGTGSANRLAYAFNTYDYNTTYNTKPDDTDTVTGGLSFTAPTTEVSLSATHKLAESDTLGQTTSVTLSATQDLWDGLWGGRGKASVDQAGLTLQVKELDFLAAQRSVAYRVKQAYYTLLGAQRTAKIKEETLAQRQEEMKKTQALFDADKASGIDVKQARINLASAQIDLRSSGADVRSSRAKLSALVGWPIGKEYAVADVEDPSAPSMEGGEALKTALADRIDLKQVMLNRRSGDISYALKKAELSPQLKGTGGSTYSRNWEREKNYLTWSVGVSLNVPIYDSGLLDAQLKAVEAQNGILAAQEEALRQSIAASVQDDLDNVGNLTDLADLAAQNVDLAQAQYELAQAQFEVGVISNLDLLSASVDLATARVNLAKAKNNLQLGILQLANTMGQ